MKYKYALPLILIVLLLGYLVLSHVPGSTKLDSNCIWFSVAPNAKYIVYYKYGHDYELWARNLEDRQEYPLYKSAPVIPPSWSEDGATIIFAGNKKIIELPINPNSSGTVIYEDSNLLIRSAKLSPDREKIAFIAHRILQPEDEFGMLKDFQENLFLLDRETNSIEQITKFTANDPTIYPLSDFSWSEDSQFIALTIYNKHSVEQSKQKINMGISYDILVLDIIKKKLRKLGIKGKVEHPNWSPDGEKIALLTYSINDSQKLCSDLAIMEPETESIRIVKKDIAAMPVSWVNDVLYYCTKDYTIKKHDVSENGIVSP